MYYIIKRKTLKRLKVTFRNIFSNSSSSPLFYSIHNILSLLHGCEKTNLANFLTIPRGFRRGHYAGRATYACKKAAAAGNRQPGNTCLASLSRPSHESLKERRSLVQPINASFSAATPPTRPTRNAH